MIRHVKFFGYSLCVIAFSWALAYTWSVHGNWWLTHCPKLIVSSIYIVTGPVLSSEVLEAEEQLEFLIFWAPTFVVLLLVILVSLFAGKILRTKNAKDR